MQLTLKTIFNLKVLAVILVLGALFTLDKTVKKSMREEEVTEFVVEILEYWKNGDTTTPMEFWMDRGNYPPMDGLASYDISRVRFIDDEITGKKEAHFLVHLDFLPHSPLPSGKKWIFQVINKGMKLKVIHFSIAE